MHNTLACGYCSIAESLPVEALESIIKMKKEMQKGNS